MILAPGETLGGYRIVDVIGIGGMAIVYRAEQVSLGRAVALKVLAPQLSRGEAFRERFRREGKHVATLDHPHVVTVYDSGEIGGHLFLAMRLVQGVTLAERLDHGGLSADETLRILGPIADALESAHAAGLVHRDMKPQNILLSSAGHPYLTDFGIAKGPETGLTATGGFLGSFNYAAPEQFLGKEATAATDVYALTAVVFQCLTGELPYPRDNRAAAVHAHLSEPLPTVESHSVGSRAFNEVIARGMAKDPLQRYDHALDLLSATSGVAEQLPDDQRRSVPTFAVSPRPISHPRPAVTDEASLPDSVGPVVSRSIERSDLGNVSPEPSIELPVIVPEAVLTRSPTVVEEVAQTPDVEALPGVPEARSTADLVSEQPRNGGTSPHGDVRGPASAVVEARPESSARDLSVAIERPVLGNADRSDTSPGPPLATSTSVVHSAVPKPDLTPALADLPAAPTKGLGSANERRRRAPRRIDTVDNGVTPRPHLALAVGIGVAMLAAIAVAVAALTMRYGGSTVPRTYAARSGPLRINYRAPWRTVTSAVAGSFAIRQPVKLEAVGETLAAGGLAISAGVPADVPPALSARYGVPTRSDSVLVAGRPGMRYNWVLNDGTSVAAFVLATTDSDIAIICSARRAPSGSLESCAKVASAASVSTADVLPPGPVAPLIAELKAKLAQTVAMRHKLSGLDSNSLADRAAPAAAIATGEKSAARSLSTIAVPPRYRDLISGLVLALKAEADEFRLLSVAAARSQPTVYARVSYRLTAASRILASTTRKVRLGGLPIPALDVLTVPRPPAEPRHVGTTGTTGPSTSSPAAGPTQTPTTQSPTYSPPAQPSTSGQAPTYTPPTSQGPTQQSPPASGGQQSGSA